MLAENYVEAFDLGSRLLAERSAEQGPDAPVTLAALQQLGAIAHLSGDQDLAEELTRIALERRRKILGNDHPDVAESLYWHGLTAQYHADRALARSSFDEAMAILARGGGSRGPLAGAITQASASLLRNESLSAAIEKYREALSIRRAGLPRPSLDVADNETWLGWCLYRAGRADEAMTHFQSAEKELRELHATRHSLMGTILNVYGNARAMQGDWPAAERYYRSTSEIFDRCRDGYLTGFARRKIPVDGLDFQALALLKQGRGPEALDCLARAHGQLTAEFVMLAQWPRIDPAGYRRVSVLRGNYFDERRRTLEKWSRDGGPLPDADWPSLVRSIETYAQVARLERDYLAIRRKLTPDHAALQRQLDGKSALIGWLQINVGADDRRSSGDLHAWGWGFVIRPDRPVAWFPLWEARGGAQLREVLAPSRRYIKRRDRAASWATTAVHDTELEADAREIGRRWLDPLLPSLRGVERLIVDASNMPFVIPVEAFRLPDDRFVCDAYDVSYVPSLTAQAHAAGGDGAAAAPLRNALTVSASAPVPAPGKSGAAGGRRSLAALPGADHEGERISALFPRATGLVGAEATEARLLDLVRGGTLDDFDVVHLATHALFDEYQERCALALGKPGGAPTGGSDGYIDAKEILRLWQLGARVVTLSGCEGSRWSWFGRGDFLGLVPALFGAGARSIVGSPWPVQDRATSLFMTRFYENLLGNYAGARMGPPGQPLAPDRALREAKLWLRDYRDAAGSRPFEHPVYWSGYVLVGFQ